MQPFLGSWEGTIDVPNGVDMNFELVLEVVDGAFRARSTSVMPNGHVMESVPAFIRVTEKGELQWGRKGRSIGVQLHTVSFVDGDTDHMQGINRLEGAQPPPAMAASLEDSLVHMRRTTGSAD